MKVLYIWKGAVHAAYHAVMEEIARHGIDLTVVVPAHWGGATPQVRAGRGYHIVVLPIRLSGHHHFHWYPRLEATVRKLKPDIVHIAEEHYSLVTYQAMRAAQSCGAKALFVTWQNIYKRYPIPFSLIEQYNFRHAASAIAGSDEIARVLKKKGYRGPLSVIPLGVDEVLFKKADTSELRKHLGTDRNSFTVGYIGRLVEEKGLTDLISAVSRLDVECGLLIVGSGPHKPALSRQIRDLRLSDRTVMIDQIASTDVPLYMNILDCLVLPSRTRRNWKEQFGRVLIEAMACEVPVVGSDSGEIPVVIGDAGLVFPEGNVDELTACLVRIATDWSLKNTLSRKGRERVLRNYTWRIVAQKTIELYNSMMRN